MESEKAVKATPAELESLGAVKASPVATSDETTVGQMEVETAFVKGEVQPPAYRDFPFAILFFIQIIGVAATAIALGPAAVQGQGEDDEASSNTTGNEDKVELGEFLVFLTMAFVGSIVVTMGFFRLIVNYAHSMVKIAFFMAPVTFGFVTLVFLASGDDISAFFGFAAVGVSVISLCLYFYYKQFMPFAAANLKTAMTAIRSNSGLYILAVFFVLLMYAWTAVWSFAVAGILYKDSQKEKVKCSDLGLDDDQLYPEGSMCEQGPNGFQVFLLLLCFYWTQQVIQNTLHVTTAGTIGSWWFTPMGDASICGREIVDSFHRATTYSFGSICFGSLLVALMQVLEQMARNQRNRRGNHLLLCILQCLLHLLRGVIEYFNSWAFVYVGLYGYDYITAGKNVLNLFRQRGWGTFISDRLVFRVLLMCNLGIAALSGCVALLVDMTMGSTFQGDSKVIAFFVGFVLGLLVSNTGLFVVESAVRSCIVCFAESPAEFDEAHPDLSEEMKSGWAEAYPTVWASQVSIAPTTTRTDPATVTTATNIV